MKVNRRNTHKKTEKHKNCSFWLWMDFICTTFLAHPLANLAE